ncbi:hypothetical protein SUNI508_09035 [Seiridium unicorne]|uniref:PWWP domain-containing protein n=1 Tax=Seiridium unicorne TaxID=138068 RepID=A0ABR2US45_9PEZI
MSDDVAAPIEQKAPETSEASAPIPAADAAAPAADVKDADAQAPAAAKEDKPIAAPGKMTTPSDARHIIVGPLQKAYNCILSAEPDVTADKKLAADTDVDMKDATEASEKAPESADKVDESKSEARSVSEKPAEDEKTTATTTTVAAEDKPVSDGKPADTARGDSAAASAPDSTPANKNRRKSAVASTGKKLNKKQSKAKIQHLDAKPGDHFFARLKGFPPWPVIVCDEEMLPQNMLNSRPVTAARPDGTYRDDYADGGKKASDRTYPVMYLQTNEFSWTRNTDLDDLDFETVADLVTPKMRKDLAAAHQLASEQNSLDDYKRVLLDFQEAKLAEAEAKAARARAKKEKTTKKSEPKVEDEDVDMPDADVQEGEESDGKKATKKRKAEDEVVAPQRSDSVKKPKIKLTTSSAPKAATNGVSSPKDSSSKTTKTKTKTPKPAKDSEGEKAKKEPVAPKEPEYTPEEKHARKEKEILFLRHRLQKGLLNRDAAIKESDMANMSDYLAKLEGFPDLEADIIRKTKINKVLKAILKLHEIPKEAEHNFKPRSQTLLEKWNKILAAEPPPGEAAAPANGVNGTAGEGAKESKEATNGVNGDAAAAPSKEIAKEAESKDEVKEAPKTESKADSAPASEKPAEEKTSSAEPSTVESAA